jgi:enamine deaminase RidA (YjgF/YER057c/UK114 family)
MEISVEGRLKLLDIVLPAPAIPAGNYLAAVVVGEMAYISGQMPRRDGSLQFVGKLGRDLDIAQGQGAARLCALNILAQLKVLCGGDLQRVDRCVRLTGYVNCTPDFADLPAVVNGASDLLIEVFGERGHHTRIAVGAAALPGNAACEIESLFVIRSAAPRVDAMTPT